MERAMSVYQVLSEKKNLVDFDGEWKETIGNPELSGSWIIWGQSSNGKTSFALMLAKYLCSYGKVLYNSLEEGTSRTMQIAIDRARMKDVARRFVILPGEPIEDLIYRLSLKKSPQIVFIDSLQYTDLNYSNYKKLKKQFSNKLFVFISHAEGNLPEGRLANKIRYDANVKIRIEGYRAIINSRFSESNHTSNYITIWQEGAERYWGE